MKNNKPLLNFIKYSVGISLALALVGIILSFISFGGITKETIPTINVISNTGNVGDATSYDIVVEVTGAGRVTIDGIRMNKLTGDTYGYSVALTQQRTNIKVLAENRYNVSYKTVTIEKNPTQEEISWGKSKAGKLCTKYPTWTKEECQGIADDYVWVGMSYEMLKELRGRPNSANPSNYGNGTEWQRCRHGHSPSCFYDNNDDSIIDSYN